MNKLLLILFVFLQLLTVNAQELTDPKPLLKDTTVKVLPVEAVTEAPKMADAFRSEGKIYVVIAVLTIIFICLITYLVYIDLKLKKIETRTKHPNNKP